MTQSGGFRSFIGRLLTVLREANALDFYTEPPMGKQKIVPVLHFAAWLCLFRIHLVEYHEFVAARVAREVHISL